MNYLEEIARKEDELLELEMEIERINDEVTDVYEREEDIEDVEYQIEKVKDEIESLREAYDDWEYDKGDMYKYNGVSQLDFI